MKFNQHLQEKAGISPCGLIAIGAAFGVLSGSLQRADAYEESYNDDYILVVEVGYTDGEWQSYFNAKVAEGYRPIWYDIYFDFDELDSGEALNQHYINAIFKKSDGLGWSMHSNLSVEEFDAKVIDMNRTGYRMLHTESWNFKVPEDYGEGGGEPRYGAIWEAQQITDQAVYWHVNKSVEQDLIDDEVEESFRPVRRSSHTAATVPIPGEVNFAPQDYSMILFEYGALTSAVDTSESLGMYYAEEFYDNGFTIIDWERYQVVQSNPLPTILTRYSIIGRQGFTDRDKWLCLGVSANGAIATDQFLEGEKGRPTIVRGYYDYGANELRHIVYWVEETPVAGDHGRPGGFQSSDLDEGPLPSQSEKPNKFAPTPPQLDAGQLHYFPAKRPSPIKLEFVDDEFASPPASRSGTGSSRDE